MLYIGFEEMIKFIWKKLLFLSYAIYRLAKVAFCSVLFLLHAAIYNVNYLIFYMRSAILAKITENTARNKDLKEEKGYSCIRVP